MIPERTDVLVVGSGAGGAAVAWALATAGVDVVVLEAGHRYRPKSFPASYPWALNHIYAGQGAQYVQSDASIYPMPSGKGVGGSTLINSAICYRAPDGVLEQWRQMGLTELAPELLAPIYEELEGLLGVRPAYPQQARLNNLMVKRGAERLGLDGAFVARNAPGCVGCGVCQLGCPSGGKGSVDRNLIPIAERLGTKVVDDAQVQEILVRNGRAEGVRFARIDPESQAVGSEHRIMARAVVLAAGSVGTPRLLLQQGLSNGSRQVGKNLSIHPAVGTYGFFPDLVNSWDGVPQAYAVYLDRKEGILLQSYNAPPEVFLATQPWSGALGMAQLSRLPHLGMCGAIVSDRPLGQVELGPSGQPRVRYALGGLERKKLLRGLRAIVDILFAAGATEVYPGVGRTWAHDPKVAHALLGDDVPETALSIYASHPMGTCRMGVSKEHSVVGPDGQSHDIPGLYIADASLFPSSLGVNPQMTVMALAAVVGRALARTLGS
jgi:choline dehydrogenase-like flavoprotein